MTKSKTIALVAHDGRKRDLADWVDYNRGALAGHDLVCTGTTGRLLAETLARHDDGAPEPRITSLLSGPLGGDQQLGAMIAEGRIDVLVFFWDPMQPQPHDVDVKALLRISVLHNVPTACNRSTADFVVSSPLLQGAYAPVKKDWSAYLERETD